MLVHTIGRELHLDEVYPLKVYKNLDYIPEIPYGETYQIIIIEEGTGIISLDNHRVIIHAPAVFLINETENVSIKETLNLRMHIVYFHPSFINKEFQFNYVREQLVEHHRSPILDLYLLNSFLFRDNTYSSHYQLTRVMLYRLLYLKDIIYDEYENQEFSLWVGRGRSYLLEMLCYLSNINTVCLQEVEPALNLTADLFDNILLYIHANYSQKITLQRLVDIFNINHTTLNNMFRIKTGESVMSYIIQLRIENSAFLIKNTDIPVKEIAYQVGYNDITNFGRAFKKLKGCSPKEYKEERKIR